MKIISYKLFSKEEDFKRWQIDNQDCRIMQITPMLEKINMAFDESSMEAVTELKVFVTYFREVEILQGEIV